MPEMPLENVIEVMLVYLIAAVYSGCAWFVGSKVENLAFGTPRLARKRLMSVTVAVTKRS